MYAVYLKDCPTAEMHTGGCGEGRPPDDLLLGGSDMTSSDPPTAGGEKGGGGGGGRYESCNTFCFPSHGR